MTHNGFPVCEHFFLRSWILGYTKLEYVTNHVSGLRHRLLKLQTLSLDWGVAHRPWGTRSAPPLRAVLFTGLSETSLGLVSKEFIHPFDVHQRFLRKVTKKDVVFFPVRSLQSSGNHETTTTQAVESQRKGYEKDSKSTAKLGRISW